MMLKAFSCTRFVSLAMVASFLGISGAALAAGRQDKVVECESESGAVPASRARFNVWSEGGKVTHINGKLSIDGFEPPSGEYVHSWQGEFPKARVAKVIQRKLSDGESFRLEVPNGKSTSTVEGSTTELDYSIIEIVIRNGQVTVGADIGDFTVDAGCKAFNLGLLRQTAQAAP